MTTPTTIAAATAVISTLLTASPTFAQGATCGDRAAIVAALESRYGEARLGAGLMQNGAVLEVYVSPERGSWTVLASLPTGQTCVVAAGTDWQFGASALRPAGQPT